LTVLTGYAFDELPPVCREEFVPGAAFVVVGTRGESGVDVAVYVEYSGFGNGYWWG
jgi:hypothetical protein